MDVKISKQNDGHLLTMATDFEKLVCDNIGLVCNILKDRKTILEELVSVVSKDNAIEEIIQIVKDSIGIAKAASSISAKFNIGTKTTNYLLNLSFEQLSDLNYAKVSKMKKEFDDQTKKLI
jgi:DNA gyrase/topoisomerase IV subunit A